MADEKRERSKTYRFKEHLQAIVRQELGVKVSMDKAWQLFKAINAGTEEFVLNLPSEEGKGKRLPLSGIGTFSVIESKPRGSKAGLDKDGNQVGESWPFVPRYRFYPSTAVNKRVEKFYGFGDHDDVELKHYGVFREDDDDTDVESPVVEEVEEEKVAAEPVPEVVAEEKPSVTVAEDIDDFDDIDL